jgi:phage terminase large subunit
MAYFDAGGKRAVAVWHRRGGKDLTILHQTCKGMHERRGAYWHVFPTAEQGRKAIWEGFTKDGKRIMEQVFPAAIRKSPREFLPKAEMVVELKCGSIWRLLGSDKIEVVGAGPVGIVFSEYSISKPSAWNLIRPMLAENEGWAAFVYTPRGNNHGKKLFDMAKSERGWFCDLRTLRETQAYDYSRTVSEARSSGMPEALIRQEYDCDWTAALVGSVWGDQIEALERKELIYNFAHETDGVFTSWDLGISDSTAIWFWRAWGNGVELVDFYENHGKPLSHYCDELDKRGRSESNRGGYTYLKHWIPHDARARTLLTGSSVEEQMISRWGRSMIAITPSLSLLDGIQAGRKLLQQEIRIHSRCGDGIEALKQYHYAYDEDAKCFRGTPEHDWTSHAADGYRYVAVARQCAEVFVPKPESAPKPHARSINQFSLDEIWDTAPQRSSGRV